MGHKDEHNRLHIQLRRSSHVQYLSFANERAHLTGMHDGASLPGRSYKVNNNPKFIILLCHDGEQISV